MVTPRKDAPQQLGLVGDLRARVQALAPVRAAAVTVAELLARGVWPHPAIIDHLRAALAASHWTIRNQPEPAPAQAQASPKVSPRERGAARSTGAITRGSQHSAGRRRLVGRRSSADTTDGRPRLQQLWFWPPEVVMQG